MCGGTPRVAAWVAQASRVLVSLSRRNNISLASFGRKSSRRRGRLRQHAGRVRYPEVLARRFFQAPRAIAVAAGPRLGAVFMPAIAPGMRVFDCEQLEILLPVWPLFLERRITETCFHPVRFALVVYTRRLHIVEIFIPGDGAAAKRPVIDRIAKFAILTGPEFCSYQITHSGL